MGQGIKGLMFWELKRRKAQLEKEKEKSPRTGLQTLLWWERELERKQPLWYRKTRDRDTALVSGKPKPLLGTAEGHKPEVTLHGAGQCREDRDWAAASVCMEAQSSAPYPRTRFKFDKSSMEGTVTLGFPSVLLDLSHMVFWVRHPNRWCWQDHGAWQRLEQRLEPDRLGCLFIWPWASYFPGLMFHFLICAVGTIGGLTSWSYVSSAFVKHPSYAQHLLMILSLLSHVAEMFPIFQIRLWLILSSRTLVAIIR